MTVITDSLSFDQTVPSLGHAIMMINKTIEIKMIKLPCSEARTRSDKYWSTVIQGLHKEITKQTLTNESYRLQDAPAY